VRCHQSFGPTLAAVACLWVVASATGRARAFSEPIYYSADSAGGGGGGRWFTGSPAEGYGCSVCHTGTPNVVSYPLYVEGLPDAGYVPGAVYDVKVSWPEFALHAQQLRTMMGTPSMGIVAELLAEKGTASGTIDVNPKKAPAGALCELPAGMPATDLFSVIPSPAAGPDSVAPPKVTHCDANQLGTRCLLAVRSCGAQELDFRWTAPAKWQGPIWFSAGFVTTDMLSGTPEGDSVREVSIPLLPATSGAAHYQAQLYNGCSAAGANAQGALWPVFAILAWLWLMRRRARVLR
jgi:uncharacterized protein (TIGR03382 family)